MRLSRLIPAPLRRRLRAALLARLDPRHAPQPQGPGFLHVIATRHGIGVFDEQWFDYRQLLLEQLTLASLDAQTHRDFVWVIAIDRDMPERARARLDRLAETRPYIRLAETELKLDFAPDLAKWVRAEAEARGREWVLTTRLDDDDAVNVNLVARLHEEAAAHLQRRTASAVLTPTSGCNWVPSQAAGHRAYHHSPSIGLSLLEKAAGAQTVYRRNHTSLGVMLAPEGVNVRHLDGPTLWWLYAHTGISDQHAEGSGRTDKIAGHPRARVLGDRMLAQFGVTPEGARLLRTTLEPEPLQTLHLLNQRGLDIEKQIQGLRESLRQNEDAALRRRIAALHTERRRMHEHLIR